MSARTADVPLTRVTLRERAAFGECFSGLYSGVTVHAPTGASAVNSNRHDDASSVVCGRR
jgi:hypothetical protein